ncbi:MAG: hypothetical protein D6775_10655 [Caldilineae bacterium]|nr:MAG: hypothetical protein D6775_10655 [Caldilineae bacterium]
MEEAAQLYASARVIATRIGDPGLTVLALLGLSRLYRRMDKTEVAWDWADEALTWARRVGYVHLEGMALLARARAAWAGGDWEAAEKDLRRAITLMTPLHFKYHLALAWLLLAGVLLHSGQEEDDAWAEAVDRIRRGRYHFLLEQERAIVLPLIARQMCHKAPEHRTEACDVLRRLAATPPAPLRIHTLGHFDVWQGPRRIPERAWSKRRAGVLFRLLLISPQRSRTQEQIVEALWPGKDMAAAQPLLHQSTSALRRALEPDLPRQFPSRYLLVQDECITLRLPPGTWVEHEVFIDLVQRGAFEEALALYQGELFSQYPYADWAIWEQERLGQYYLRALLGASEQALAANQPERALQWARAALEQEPWQEQAVRLGMEACLVLGDRAGALRMYKDLEERLRAELGIGPGKQLSEYYRQIVEG